MSVGSLSNKERAHCSNAVLTGYDNALAALRKMGALVSNFSSQFGYSDLADDNEAITSIEAYFNHGYLYEQADLPMDEDVRNRVMCGKI